MWDNNFFSLSVVEQKAVLLQLAIQCLTPKVASSLSHHPEIVQLVLDLLRAEKPFSSSIPSPQVLVLNQVTFPI